MFKKTCLLLIIVFVYTAVMVNCQPPLLKKLGYQQLLDAYARTTAACIDCRVVYDPGLRRLDKTCPEDGIKVVLPDSGAYAQIMAEIFEGSFSAVVECSSLDAWHTTSEGLQSLLKLRKHAYRVVVFDGGHHLPTLGLQPDIIIIPELNGYAVHSYMLDGIKTDKLLSIIKESGLPIKVVSVPRWALVKNRDSLQFWALKALLSTVPQREAAPEETFAAAKRMSHYRECLFAYITETYADDIDVFLHSAGNLKQAGKIYLAFDYRCINSGEAKAYSQQVSQKTGCTVEIVNEPVKVSNILWGGK